MNDWEHPQPDPESGGRTSWCKASGGRYCGGAVALKKAGGSAIPLPPGSDLPGADVAARPPGRTKSRNTGNGTQAVPYMEVSSIGRTPASQAGKAGSIPVTSSKVRKTEAPGFRVWGGIPHTAFLPVRVRVVSASRPPPRGGRAAEQTGGVPSDGEDNPSVGSADSSTTGEPRPNSILAQPGRVPAGRRTVGEVPVGIAPPS